MMNVGPTTVFVSSVIEGLEDYRQAIVDVANRLNTQGYRFSVVRADKELAASIFNPLQVCYEGIDNSNVCLCILGPRYGYVHPDSNLSISEMEFDYAVEGGRGILAFVLDCTMEARQQAFKDKVGNIVTGNFFKSVASLGKLEFECAEALRALIAGKPRDALVEVFRSYSAHLLNGIINELPAPIGKLERPEVGRVLELLSTGNSVLLIGDRGSGKSGILKAVCEQAQQNGVPLLALAPATYPREATSLSFLEQSLSLPTSLTGALLEVADAFGRMYVVVDQLDFVRGTDLGRTLVHALLTVTADPRIFVLAACRTFDSERDELLSLKAAGLRSVEVSPVSPPTVRALLAQAGLQDEPAEAVLQLGTNLLLLSLIIHLIRKGRSLESLAEAIDLWESFADSVRATEGEEAFARAIALARESLLEGRADLAPSMPFDIPTQRLIASGILAQLPFDRVKFRHEELQFFLYAWHIVRNGYTASDAAGELGPQIARRVLPHVHLLKRKLGPDHEASLFREVFEVTDA